MAVKLDVFNRKDLQHCIALLNVFEGSGVTDIVFIREQISSFLLIQQRESQKEKLKINKKTLAEQRKFLSNQPKPRPCPECGHPLTLIAMSDGDDITILECANCRYSEILTQPIEE